MFKSEEEYKEFLVWAIEGSTIQQRMDFPRAKPEIPEHWKKFKEIAAKMPQTFAEFQRELNLPLEENDPINPPTPADPID